MFAEFFAFDLRYQWRAPLLWVAGFVFALFAFGATSSDFIQVGGAIGNVHRNAPAVILGFYATFSLLGLFVVTVFIAQPLLRDFELRTEELFFSTPMRRQHYLAGRIAAGCCAALIVFVLSGAGMIIGAAMPWVDPQRLGPFSLAPHLWSLAVIVIPNMLFMAALLSLLAVTARSLLSVYLGVIGFFVLWAVAGFLTQDIQYDRIGALIDPFGARALENALRYWSPNERNTRLPDLTGYLLVNRLLWVTVAAGLFAGTFALFRPQRIRSSKRWLRRAALRAEPPVTAARTVAIASHDIQFKRDTAFQQFLHQLRFDTASVLKSVPFLVLVAFGMLNLVSSSTTIDDIFGTKILPVTAVMLNVIDGSYSFLLILIVGFYAGDLVWRERNAGLAQLADSMPVPNWVPLLAKIGALLAVVIVFMLAGVFACIGIQLFRGYTNLQIGLYLAGVLIQALPFMLMGVAAIVLQVIANNKFVGYLLFVLLMVLQIALPPLHLEHNLYNFSNAPAIPYSDMNGYGHFLKGWLWFELYWTLFTLALVLLASAMWVRGSADSMRLRLRQAGSGLRGPQGIGLAVTMLAFAAVGAWIFYNTNVLNEYLPADKRMDRQVYYEKTYRKFKDVLQPKITDVYADVDIFPAERRVEVRGRYQLVNRYAEPIADLHMQISPDVALTKAVLAGASVVSDDPRGGYRLYRLDQPLQPGASVAFEFTVERAERGFTNAGLGPAEGGAALRSAVNYNGTFFNNLEMMPHFGYQESQQIIDRGERRKRGLGEVPRMPKLEDEAARDSTGFVDADWINFETVVSTSADQTALAPGYLQKEWVENGRHYFHYKMDRPMLPFFCYLSANWQIRRDRWHDVPIEIYYDPQHPYNVERMIEGTKKSLDYFTRNFTPYQHAQVRILEFPRYARFAQSFANTIPFSESIGFVADLRDPDDLDYVFYVTAHEVAHQWWGHQVFGARVQGQSMLTESLAQYSAMMVMEQQYGADHIRKYLKYELDRYLRSRGGELIEELPLMRVEDQPYIHYRKGSMVFYRLRDTIGEQALNRALSQFLADNAFERAPYSTTQDLLQYLRAATPPEQQQLLDELFAKIVFYDNRVTAAKVSERSDGKFDVTLEFSAGKYQVDGTGKESPLPMSDWIDVGAFAKSEGSKSADKVLYLKKHHITTSPDKLTFVVDAKPYDVGIDPYNKLIDRNGDDNRKVMQ